MTIDASASYTAVINTNKGSITLELFAQDAPVTVNNFVFLAEAGFYDGIIFHRVIPGFMIQGGDPTGTGFNGPGYQFQDELESDRVFSAPGVLAMANAGANTNGSQFFITVAPTPNLTGRHTIFGEVTQGQDVADTISLVRTAAANRPVEDVVIRSIDITRNGG
jgi:cyclophilin family peptidyl-prolyl cis-trans isomerase